MHYPTVHGQFHSKVTQALALTECCRTTGSTAVRMSKGRLLMDMLCVEGSGRNQPEIGQINATLMDALTLIW